MKAFSTYINERGKHRLNPGLLWEYRLDNFDWQKYRRVVAERVISMGRLFDWYAAFDLYGGTALSLQIGHRESDDLDLFSVEPLEGMLIQKLLLRRYPAYDPIMADKAIIYFGDIDEMLIPEIRMLGYVFDFQAVEKRIIKMTDYPDKVYTTAPLKRL